MKKVSILMCSFLVISALAVPVFAAETASPAPTAVVTSATAKTKAVPKVTIKSLKEKFADQISQLQQLKTDNKAIHSKDKAVNQEIKSKTEKLKISLKSKSKTDRKAYVSNLKTQISPLRSSIKSLKDDVAALRNQRKAQVTNLKDAFKAKDEAKISTTLTSIIDLQKKINQKYTLALDLKAKISQLIK